MAFVRAALVVGCFFAKCKIETIGYPILLKLISFTLTNGTMSPFFVCCWRCTASLTPAGLNYLETLGVCLLPQVFLTTNCLWKFIWLFAIWNDRKCYESSRWNIFPDHPPLVFNSIDCALAYRLYSAPLTIISIIK